MGWTLILIKMKRLQNFLIILAWSTQTWVVASSRRIHFYPEGDITQ